MTVLCVLLWNHCVSVYLFRWLCCVYYCETIVFLSTCLGDCVLCVLLWNHSVSVYLLGEYVLSVHDYVPNKGACVKHYKIRNMDDGGCYITLRVTFSDLFEMVEHYKSKTILAFLLFFRISNYFLILVYVFIYSLKVRCFYYFSPNVFINILKNWFHC